MEEEMKNLVQQSGRNITVAAPYNLTSGDGALVGLIFGIASTTALSGAQVALSTNGVYDIKKTASDTFAVGAAVYWDNSAKSVTSTSSGNTKIGVATKAAAGSDATARVRLNGTF
jgi:predicted RecA/RadA family phage recombinase